MIVGYFGLKLNWKKRMKNKPVPAFNMDVFSYTIRAQEVMHLNIGGKT